MSDDSGLLLGEIKGKMDMMLDAQKETNERISSIDDRLRSVEISAAKSGALAGGIAAIGVAIITAKLKGALGL